MTTRNRFARHSLDRVFGGVCGGIGATLAVSAWWVRGAFVALGLTLPVFAALLYLLFWIILPGQGLADLPAVAAEANVPRPESILIVGALCVIIGVLALADNLNILSAPQGDLLVPVTLLLIGLALLLRQLRRSSP